MKVLLIGTLVGKGGIQSHLRWLARALSDAGVHTLILSLGNNLPTQDDLWTTETLENQLVTVKFFPPYPSGILTSSITRIQRLWTVKQSISQFSPNVCLTVGTGWNLFLPLLLSRTKARRIFFEVMSGIPVGPRDSRWCVKWWFDEVVGQSPTVARTFEKHFNWQKCICAIPAIPEPLEFTAVLPKVRAKKVEIGNVKAALFSRLVPHKQAFWLVRQWDVLKNLMAELHIHGSGPEEPLIREYIEQQGIGDRVKCFGRYPERQAYADLLSSYDLSLLPTIGDEGAPTVLLESMACGVPFVAYGVGGIIDYGTNNPNVSILAPKETSFVAGIEDMIMKLAAGAIDQQELQRHYLQHYSFEVLSRRWLDYLTLSHSD